MKSRFIIQDGRTELVFMPESLWERAALHQMTCQEVKTAKWITLNEQPTFSDRGSYPPMMQEPEPFLRPYRSETPPPNALVVVLEEPPATDAEPKTQFVGKAVPMPSVQSSP